MKVETNRSRPARRPWSFPSRFLVSLLVALCFHGVYAGWHWDLQHRSGRGLFALAATGRIWRRESVRATFANWMHETLHRCAKKHPALYSEALYRLVFAISTVGPVSLVGVGSYAWLTRRLGPTSLTDPECRCRRCGYILSGLERPRCPECGEAI